jgi:hypothetical protein
MKRELRIKSPATFQDRAGHFYIITKDGIIESPPDRWKEHFRHWLQVRDEPVAVIQMRCDGAAS